MAEAGRPARGRGPGGRRDSKAGARSAPGSGKKGEKRHGVSQAV